MATDIKKFINYDILYRGGSLLKILPAEGRITKEISLSKTKFCYYGGELCSIETKDAKFYTGDGIDWLDEEDNLIHVDDLFHKVIEIENL